MARSRGDSRDLATLKRELPHAEHVQVVAAGSPLSPCPRAVLSVWKDDSGQVKRRLTYDRREMPIASFLRLCDRPHSHWEAILQTSTLRGTENAAKVLERRLGYSPMNKRARRQSVEHEEPPSSSDRPAAQAELSSSIQHQPLQDMATVSLLHPPNELETESEPGTETESEPGTETESELGSETEPETEDMPEPEPQRDWAGEQNEEPYTSHNAQDPGSKSLSVIVIESDEEEHAAEEVTSHMQQNETEKILPRCPICYKEYDSDEHQMLTSSTCGHCVCSTCKPKIRGYNCSICREFVGVYLRVLY